MSEGSILLSVGLAVLHAILECIQLYCEALACKTTLTKYCVVCFNGRFGWVPFVENMDQVAVMADNQDANFDEQQLYLDYDNIYYSNKCLSAHVMF